MKTHSLLLAAIIASLLTAGLSAQEKKKLYRWVDKDGKVQISDQLPPEAVNQARKEINAKGASTGIVDRALTDEERAAQAKLDQELAMAKKISEQQARIEQAMMINYATEDDLRRTYKERIDLLQQTIESTDISIKSIRGSLTAMLAQAGEAELTNRPIDKVRSTQIRELHGELLKQQDSQIESHNNVKAMEGEFASVLARYRELRGASIPAPDASTAPPAGTTPQAPPTPAK